MLMKWMKRLKMQQCKIKTYNKYKDSGIEWIGKIPQHWEIKKLKQIISKPLQYGANERGDAYNEQYPRYIRITDIKVEDSSLKNEGKLSLSFEKAQDYILEDGNILFARSGATVGKTFLYQKEYGLSAFAGYLIRASFEKFIIPKYIYYYTLTYSYEEWKNRIFIQATIQNIGANKYNNLEISLPNKAGQQQIVEYLDKKCGEVDRVVEVQKLIIEKLKEYKQSVITEAVTKGLDKNTPLKDSGIEWIGKIPQHWNIQRIKTLGEYRNGLIYSPDEISDEDNGILVLRSSNISNGKIIFEDNVYINKSIPENMMLKIGDILICSRNGSRELVGKNAIIDFNFRASFGAFMMIFRCNCYKYMYYILNSHVFNYYLGSFHTSTINQLTGKNFGDMIIVYCNNTDEQNVIVEYLDKKCSEIDKAISEKEVLIEKLTQYKKSLIYECVTGKRKVVA